MNAVELLAAARAAVSPLEGGAVALAIAYLVLAIRQNPWCWAAALGSTALYVVVMYRAGLYMESALQFFYIAIAVHGWLSWTRGGSGGAGLAVTRWPWRRHLLAIGGVLALAGVSGFLLSRYTAAALPYVDSFTTWGAVVTTWMVARKVLENWIYWFVIDGVSVGLYLSRDLYATAALFVGYLVLVVIGFLAWRRALVR